MGIKTVFTKIIEDLDLRNKKTLLAVSGGVDSMVLAHLFNQYHLPFSIAHVNYQLREEQSQEDAKLVEQIAAEYQVPFYKHTVDTENWAKEQKLGIQEAARNIRYAFFADVVKKEELYYIATAHHFQDSIETVLINMVRGTGIHGLSGISLQKDRVIRPLIEVSKEEVNNYALVNKLVWREDQSNFKKVYLRNKIRWDVAKDLIAINKEKHNGLQRSINNVQKQNALYDELLQGVRNKVLVEKEGSLIVDLIAIEGFDNKKELLYEMLKFTEINKKELLKLYDSPTGKSIVKNGYELIKDRNSFLWRKQLKSKSNEVQIINNIQEWTLFIDSYFDLAKISTKKLNFPLYLRETKQEDVFFPLGMKGKRKKVSKFLKDLKLSKFQREEAVILTTNDNIIIAILNYRLDERFI